MNLRYMMLSIVQCGYIIGGVKHYNNMSRVCYQVIACVCGEVHWLNKSVLRLLIGELDHNCMIRYETLQHISLWGHAGFGTSLCLKCSHSVS